MPETEPVMITCETHGTTVACVVCQHLVKTCDRVVGFVENSDDPNDLQAWCDACEHLYSAEREKSPRFLEFCDAMLVCTGCYSAIKARNLTGAA